MSESKYRLDINLFQILWWNDGRLTTIFNVDFCAASWRKWTIGLALPRISLYVYSNRFPILSIEYRRGHSGGLLWAFRQWRASRRPNR